MAATKGSSGLGGQLYINTAADATITLTSGVPTAVVGGTWVAILEQSSSIGIETKGVYGGASHMQSAAAEYIPLLQEPVETPVTFNYVPGDPGQEALLTAMNTVPIPLKQFKYVAPLRASQTTAGEIRVFHAFPSGGVEEPINAVTPLKCSLRITGGYARIAGS